MINLWHLEQLFSFDELLHMFFDNHLDLNDEYNKKKYIWNLSHEDFPEKYRDMKYLYKFGSIWSIYDILSSYIASMSFYICFWVIIWILMMNSTRKNTYVFFLMKIFQKWKRDMKYLDKFGSIWSIYYILINYSASMSFYICF